MAGASRGAQKYLQATLFGGLDRVEAPVSAQADAEAADLAHRLAAVAEELGMLTRQPGHTEPAAGLLVGRERDHHVPCRAPAGARI